MAKILLVEDDNNLREIYEARLQAEGFTIVSAHDGEEALVVAKNERPDLIISDVMMPKISGFEMLDIIRATPTLANVKIIMLTALGQNEDQDRANKLGADKYLVKSQVTLEDIVNSTNELLSQPSAPSLDQLNNDTLTNASDQADTVQTSAETPIMPPQPSESPTIPQNDYSAQETTTQTNSTSQSSSDTVPTSEPSVQLPEMDNISNQNLINQAVEAINSDITNQTANSNTENLPPSMNNPSGSQRILDPISSQEPKLNESILNESSQEKSTNDFDPNNIAL